MWTNWVSHTAGSGYTASLKAVIIESFKNIHTFDLEMLFLRICPKKVIKDLRTCLLQLFIIIKKVKMAETHGSAYDTSM